MYWNEFIVNLIVRYREVVMPAVIASLQPNLASHWNANVLSLSYTPVALSCGTPGPCHTAIRLVASPTTCPDSSMLA